MIHVLEHQDSGIMNQVPTLHLASEELKELMELMKLA